MKLSRERVHQAVLLVIDAVFVMTSFFIAVHLADSGIVDIHYRATEYLWMLSLLLAVNLFIFYQTGLYREIIRYASMEFAVKIVKSTVFASLLSIGLIHIVRQEIGMSVLVIDWMANCILIGLSRFGARYVMEGRINRASGKKALLYGAGEHGAAVARHLMRNDQFGYHVVGFIDDNPAKQGKKIQGLPVIGDSMTLSTLLREKAIEEMIVTFANAEGELIKQLFRKCREQGVRCRIVPGMADVISKSDFVRNIDIADLMRRPQRNLDKQMIGKFLKNRRILITGAAGSIGSEIFRQVLSYEPSALAAIDNSEFGLYRLNEEVSNHPLSERCLFSLVDIKSRDLVDEMMTSFRPDVIFHAAAYKHVPILEQDVRQAVLNNVDGLLNVLQAAEKCSVRKFVFISSDKAVRPTNIMGATKRIGELITRMSNGCNGMNCVGVRFGNVLASSGSVVPKFIEQIKAGGPVTVTHPEVSRYFMLISEAVELVLQAASLGQGGEVFVLDMGKSVKITEMAEDLISLMGYVPHSELRIVYTGLRPGEKLHEELFLDEVENKTSFNEIYIGKDETFDKEEFRKKVDELLRIVRQGDVDKIRGALKRVVPEYSMGIQDVMK